MLLVRISIIMIKHHDQSNMESEVASSFQLLVHHSGKSGQEHRTGSWRKESCLLACYHHLLSLVSYSTQDHQPRSGSTKVTESFHINYKSWKCSKTCSQVNLMGDILSIDISASQVTLDWIHLNFPYLKKIAKLIATNETQKVLQNIAKSTCH